LFCIQSIAGIFERGRIKKTTPEAQLLQGQSKGKK